MTETAFATELLRWAKTWGWKCFHVRNSGYGGNTYVQGDRGFPDLVLLRGQRMIVAELKIEKKKPSLDQVAWLDAFQGLGARAIETYVWRPDMFEEIVVILSHSGAR